jgi:hypothetical protein
MDDGPRGFRFSSARRNRGGPSPAIIAAIAAVSLVVAIAVLYRPAPPEVVQTVPTPTQAPTPAPSPTATATPTPVELASEWVVASSPEVTPTPWPTSPPALRREPTPTPKVSECVSFRWTTVQVFTPSAQVLTEIKTQNNCNRDIQPTDLMFEISGWRDGGLVQSVRGMPFDRIRRRHSGIISIGLPGSLDWYDEITVVIID